MRRAKNWILSSLLCVLIAPVLVRAEEAPKSSSGGLPEWVQIQGRLQTLKAKVHAKEAVVMGLIAAKAKEKDPQKAREIVKNLTVEHKDLQAQIEEYEKQRNLLKYRFPEKGMKDDRSYQRMEARSVEEMETQVGLDRVLQNTVQRIREQYGSGEAVTGERVPASKSAPAMDLDKRSILEPAVISK